MFEMRPVYYQYESSRAGKVRSGNDARGASSEGVKYHPPSPKRRFLMSARKAPGMPAYKNNTSTPGRGSMIKVAFSHSTWTFGFTA